jgi:hypothetical protein
VTIGGSPDLKHLGEPGPRRGERAREPSLRREALEAVMPVYGRNDPLLAPAQEFWRDLERRGAVVPAAIYEGEGAPLRGRRNRADALERIEQFLMTRL